MKQVKEYFKEDYKDKVIDTLEKIIKHHFPKIQNLTISSKDNCKLQISFNEGIYTKQEVEDKINEVKNYSNSLSSSYISKRK